MRDAIVAATAPLIADAFLLELVRQLRTAFAAECVFIAEDADARGTWRYVAVAEDRADGLREGDALPVRGTANERAAAGERVAIPRQATSVRPSDIWLQARGAESYLALPLVSGGAVIGILGVAGTTPMRAPARAEALIAGFLPRAAVILERRRMQRREIEDDLRLRLLADHASDVIFRLRLLPERAFEYVSPAVTRITGYAPREFLDDPDLGVGIVHEDDRARVAAAVRAATPQRFTARWRHRDGRMLWADYSVVPVINDAGVVEATEGIIRDVTDRVQLEYALIESERRQKAVISALPDMVFRIDGAGTYLEYIAAEGSEPFVAPEEFIGRLVRDVLPPEIAMRAMAAISLTLRTGETARIEYDLPSEGGGQHFEARIVPSGLDEVLAFVRDFTAEHRLAAEEARRVDRDRLEQDVERSMTRGNPYGLTFREYTVLHHVASGAADKQIAESLGISTYTVSKHVASILMKMRVPSRAAAGVRAVREGLIA